MRRHGWLMVATVVAALGVGAAGAQGQKLPDKRQTETGNWITLHAVSLPSGAGTASADVEICASDHTPRGTMAVPQFFSVQTAAGSTVKVTPAGKAPLLVGTPLAPTQCVRGWLNFPVAAGDQLVALRYHSMMDKGNIDWPLH